MLRRIRKSQNSDALTEVFFSCEEFRGPTNSSQMKSHIRALVTMSMMFGSVAAVQQLHLLLLGNPCTVFIIVSILFSIIPI